MRGTTDAGMLAARERHIREYLATPASHPLTRRWHRRTVLALGANLRKRGVKP